MFSLLTEPPSPQTPTAQKEKQKKRLMRSLRWATVPDLFVLKQVMVLFSVVTHSLSSRVYFKAFVICLFAYVTHTKNVFICKRR